MHINQFAIYRADQNTLQGRKLWHHTMEFIREKKLSIRIEYYKQKMIAGLVAKDETVPKIRERFQHQIGKMAPFIRRMENWQKSYENGEYLRSAESGTEANYDMIDGRVNNSVKPKDKAADKANEGLVKTETEPVKPVTDMVNILFYDDSDVLAGNNVAKTIYEIKTRYLIQNTAA